MITLDKNPRKYIVTSFMGNLVVCISFMVEPGLNEDHIMCDTFVHIPQCSFVRFAHLSIYINSLRPSAEYMRQ